MIKKYSPANDKLLFPPHYRLGVGLMILNKQKQIFVGKRFVSDPVEEEDSLYGWQMPQGGIDYNESPYKAALREMKEEIGTDNVHLLAESAYWYTYTLPKSLARTLWGGRFDGQKQKWYLFEFQGQESEINIHTRHPEFLEWKWMSQQEIQQLIVPFKRRLYEQVFSEFSPFLKV